MEVGSIVFAPFNQKVWPGKIISLGLMAQIQFYKIKSIVKVPIKTLQEFSHDRIFILLAQYNDKSLAAAVKMAQKELNERFKSQQEQTKRKKDYHKNGLIKGENIETENQIKPTKINEPMKKEQEEEDDRTHNQLPSACSFSNFLLQLNENELISDSKENKPKQFCFFNLNTQRLQKYLRQPNFLLNKLTQKLMRKVMYQNSKQGTEPLQKRINNILNSANFDMKSILKTNILMLINLTIKRREQLPWINNLYIQVILKFKQKMCEKMSNSLDDYAEIGVLINRATNLQLETSF